MRSWKIIVIIVEDWGNYHFPKVFNHQNPTKAKYGAELGIPPQRNLSKWSSVQSPRKNRAKAPEINSVKRNMFWRRSKGRIDNKQNIESQHSSRQESSPVDSGGQISVLLDVQDDWQKNIALVEKDIELKSPVLLIDCTSPNRENFPLRLTEGKKPISIQQQDP